MAGKSRSIPRHRVYLRHHTPRAKAWVRLINEPIIDDRDDTAT